MATYNPTQLGITAPTGGFQTGGWYSGRQYWNGSLSDPGVIHPESNQQGAGTTVSPEVNAQSAAAQGVSATQLESYLQEQRATQPAGAVDTGGGMPALTTGGATGGAGIGYAAETPLDLQSLYKSLNESAGIAELQNQMSSYEKQFIEAKAKLNDNPFLSEATRVGREAKLNTLYQERVASLQKDLATKKADVETQINLATKQFDINSTSAQQALARFNTLLGMGALSGASGEDIANITRATGISSTMLQAAIKASQQKDVKTQLVTNTADNGTVTTSLINMETGAVIKQTSLGSVGNAQTGGGGTTKPKYASSADVEIAKSALSNVDTNGDNMLSLAEYEQARQAVYSQISDPAIAASALETASTAYKKWNW